ncbi:hypothetical protein [Roseobacter weihaiensis]|uniref:hypothetical protein n=1 Tax=Roseobacter weihaiensis TaxID=2763262 RepID=UPI001D0A1478|nr:hypothetical protein [Roseobacter sp. H9]
MSKFATARTPSERRKNTAPRPIQTGGKTSPASSALQAKADQSPATGALDALQRRAIGVVQREIDTSTSPFLPDYAQDEKAGWEKKDRTGVADWAKDDYKSGKGKTGAVDRTPLLNRDFTTPTTARDARDPANGPRLWAVQEFLQAEKTVMVSMVDGKIGSIYFDGGRVRTTHGGGPTEERHDPGRTLQLNIDHDQAEVAFEVAHPRGTVPRDQLWSTYKRFLVETLANSTPATLPAWITVIHTPTDAAPEETDTANTQVKLFEIMVNQAGQVTSTHPSRGIGTQMRITNADMLKLRQGVKLVSDIADVRARNQMFYNFVVRHLNHLAPLLRNADEVKYYD